MLIDTVRDIERIGDHCENLIELVDYQITNKVKLTDAIAALDDKDTALATKVLKTERQIDKLERILRKKHILRIHEAECIGQVGIVFVEIISNLERIGDHCVNIAEAVLGYRN